MDLGTTTTIQVAIVSLYPLLSLLLSLLCCLSVDRSIVQVHNPEAVCFSLISFHSPGRKMDESEFQRLLSLFPVVRSRDYHVDLVASSSRSISQSGKDEARKELEGWNEAGEKDTETKDDFWDNLRSAAEKKVGEAEAEKFCNAFRKVYHKLVYEGLNKEAARRFINAQ